MTTEQLHILQHALGVDQYGRGQQYRNMYCAGGKDIEICRDLVALGYMSKHYITELFPYFNCSVTAEGKRAMLAESPNPPKLTRSQRRYREWLDSGTGDCGWKFGEWLKRKAEA